MPMASPGVGSYRIDLPTGVCSATGRRLHVGEAFVGALVEAPGSDDLRRLDFSHAAWEAGSRPAAPCRLLGFWRGVVAPPDTKPHVLIDDESLMDLFEQSAEQAEPRRAAFRFVLALILVRKRLLVHEGSSGTVMLVRPKGAARPPQGPPLIEVVDPGLDEDAIAAVIEQFEALMAGGGSA